MSYMVKGMRGKGVGHTTASATSDMDGMTTAAHDT